ncbi:hypothetical protein BX616_003082 [Lobosporangium transversale]|uniref:Ricin B lectin domain-containing protein n=1 Tax=Lobosporangium transversale TaxID=64571 RepID=A0A1Y2GJ59_9FUNG|nr:hypothetical protein BCR41DRAFT_372363 [Lobosporangium transversale]KAF9899356.1 hypothetical protein BX616_003082 [Lobosporangium transversale]ORZ10622.1 hypothetical protein BCR41DRAFT_372363 [Lobosporangium transversale]|eukprot:XP_021879343.1 hypothetical protein BCR41DRAFT_372363 [Lobosporangium transversale]
MARSVALLVALLALLQVALAEIIGSGFYRIMQRGLQISTKKDGGETPAILYPRDGHLEQVWHIQSVDHTHITISSPGTSRQLALHDQARPNAFVIVAPKQRIWRIQRSARPGFYNIIYPEKFGGEDLAIGISPSRIYPPQIALQYVRGFGATTVDWELRKVE